MKRITFTEFRKRASGFLTEVENGETLLVLRHGKVIAQIIPPDHDEPRLPLWKSPRLRLSINGLSLSKVILKERED